MGGQPPLSPLAPTSFPELPEIGGATFATAEAGVRYSGRPDVMLAKLSPGTAIAGVEPTDVVLENVVDGRAAWQKKR